ncbi:MAG: hypothetical protein H6Q31_854 [Bacteroidetes bacterium]|nr:hypothetical protein [Bacteroidota bacterium]
MKRVRMALLIVLSVVAAFVLVRAADAQQDKRPKQQHVVWEYRDAANLNIAQLNTIGAEGWELAVVTPYGKDYYYIFKRPKL